MKAIQMARYGASDVLQLVDCEQPRAKQGQYVVRVHASSVNPIDWKLRKGALRLYMWPRLPLVPGFDIAGEVVEARPGSTRFRVGDAVYARLDHMFGGAYAEYALVGEAALAGKPASSSFRQAAAVPLVALTALQALRSAGLQQGQHALIVGGAGGVGHAAVQIAKILGAHVVASCSTSNVELVRSLGADAVIDYRSEPYRAVVAPYDVIFDTVVANRFVTFAPLMAANGCYVAATPSPELMLRAPWLALTSKRRIRFAMMKPSGEQLAQLAAWIDAGQLRPVVDRVYPLAEAAAAHAYAEQGHVRGKVVLDVASDG